ncbi:hypothetical protein L1049_012138 [Liquidambar formosana]|uniref:Telomerase reverse transcriptase n=1 Tax=Liquidambar formosana TaxID=63359 RepID=A0AAP0X306_LIQFO
MHKLKTSRFPFISNKHSSCHLSNHGLKFARGQSVDMHNECRELNDASYFMKHKVLERWIFWLFSCLVVPLVQANFYVTESEHGKQDMFYYRKSIWEKLTSSAITCLKDRSFHSLDGASVRNIISNRSFGFSKLRLCPKENGVRVLANLKASSRMPSQESLLRDQSCRMHKKARLHPKRVKFDHFKSVNCVLRDLHAVLKGLQMKESEKLGSSVFDYNDVYRKLCPFLIGLKNESTIMPRVFVVISDVVKAFDSVDQDKLLSIMKNVFLQDEYLLKQFHQVVCTKKSLRVHEKSIFSDSISNGLTKFASSVLFRSLHTVLVDKEWSRNIRKEDLYFNLTEHVKRNVLQFDRKFYLQDVGIPQGSVLSSLLCSFYYGHLERSVIFPFLEKVSEPASEDLSGRHNFHKCCSCTEWW